MFFFFSSGDKLKDSKYLGIRLCGNCRGFQHYYLYKKESQFSLYFIPIFSWGKEYFIGCGRCKAGYAIEEDEALRLIEKYKNHVSEKVMNEIYEYLSIHASGMNNTEESRHILYERYRNRFFEYLDRVDRKEIEIMIDQILVVNSTRNYF